MMILMMTILMINLSLQSSECGQELTVDWSRGRKYSKNLVARDLASLNNTWEEDIEEGNTSQDYHQYHDVSGVLREIG